MFRFASYALVTVMVVAVSFVGCGKRVAVEEAPGSLIGSVTDSRTGKPVQATVQIIGTKTGAMCDIQGNYRIARLAPGIYDLRVAGVYYITLEVTDVVIRPGETSRVDIKLEMMPAEPMDTPHIDSED